MKVHAAAADPAGHVPRLRFEVILPPPLAETFLDFLRRDIMPHYPLTAAVETIEVLRADDFVARPAGELVEAVSR